MGSAVSECTGLLRNFNFSFCRWTTLLVRTASQFALDNRRLQTGAPLTSFEIKQTTEAAVQVAASIKT